MPSSAIRTSDNVTIFEPNKVDRSFEIDKKDYGNIFRVAIGKLGAFYNSAKSSLKTLFGFTCCTVAVPRGYTINPDYTPLLNRLKYQTDLGDDAMHKYCEILAKLHPSAQLIDTYLMNHRSGSPVLPERGNDIKQLMIPIVLDESPKNHIVAAFVSFDEQDNATIEYYDSKGLKIGDRGAGARLAYCPDLTLGAAIASIADKYCPNKSREGRTELPRILQNETRDQKDCHNCGVYVCNYFEQRLNHLAAPLIYRTCNSFERTMPMRENMIRNVLLEARQPIPTKVAEKDPMSSTLLALIENDDDSLAAVPTGATSQSALIENDEDDGILL